MFGVIVTLLAVAGIAYLVIKIVNALFGVFWRGHVLYLLSMCYVMFCVHEKRKRVYVGLYFSDF